MEVALPASWLPLLDSAGYGVYQDLRRL